MVIVIPVCQPDACLADLVHQLRQKTDYPILVVDDGSSPDSVSYTHLRAHETGRNLVCRLLLEKKKEPKRRTHISKDSSGIKKKPI